MNKKPVNNNDIISDTLGCGPDVSIKSPAGLWELSRWRQFVSDYTLPTLPEPVYVMHFAGKPVRTWEKKQWSEGFSSPGCATIVPAGSKTGWQVNGELDTVTLSLSADILKGTPAEGRFRQMNFAFFDRLSSALTHQIVAELYNDKTSGDDPYIHTLINTLIAHIQRDAKAPKVPTNKFAANRIHQIIGLINSNQEKMFTVDELADHAGVTVAHFCRIFKQGTGLTPHQFIVKNKVERAQLLLSQTALPINTIADQLGFASQSQFSRAFRALTGFSPSDHRTRTGNSIQ